MYDKLKRVLKPFPFLYIVIKFLITPYRVIREKRISRNLALEAINTYSQFDPKRNTIFYLGIPEHNNLGDIGQTYCTCKWIGDNYSDYNLLKVRTKATRDMMFINFIKENIKENDIILLQSGYCSRYKNPDHIMHKKIAKYLSDSRIVILPQTVKLSNKNDIEETRKLFSKCKKMVFISRDKISYESAKDFVEESHLVCFPDIVTSLIGRMSIEKSERKGALLCIRNDDEKFYTDEQINFLRRKLEEIYEKVDIRDTNSKYSVEYTFEHLDEVIREIVNDFAKYEVIITDRYHGTIFSLVADTPVIVIKTNDHKVVSAVEWFNGLFENQAVQRAGDLDIAVEIAKKVHENNHMINNCDILFSEYYAYKLKNLVESYRYDA